MQKKQVAITPKSIKQDIAVNQFPADAAYSIRNMRIVTTGSNTSLSLVNEKGNSLAITLDYSVIGCQELNNNVILFTTNNTTDCIYLIKSKDDELKKYVLYEGKLGFSTEYPIETIGVWETSEIQKIYWVDSIHTPRVIRLNLSDGTNNYTKYIKDYNSSDNIDYQFDYNPHIEADTNTAIEVKPLFNTNGNFDAGVIQYALSYYNYHGTSTGVVAISPLYYTSDNGRGLNPDGTQKSSISFEIQLYNLDTSFDYARIYRIHRTSIDATPNVVILKDIKIDKTN